MLHFLRLDSLRKMQYEYFSGPKDEIGAALSMWAFHDAAASCGYYDSFQKKLNIIIANWRDTASI